MMNRCIKNQEIEFLQNKIGLRDFKSFGEKLLKLVRDIEFHHCFCNRELPGLMSFCEVADSLFLLCRSSSLPDAVAGTIHNVPSLDTQWIETTSKKAALKLEKLDTDLKNYKSNSIKESIRQDRTLRPTHLPEIQNYLRTCAFRKHYLLRNCY